jgi:hypothetical protein
VVFMGLVKSVICFEDYENFLLDCVRLKIKLRLKEYSTGLECVVKVYKTSNTLVSKPTLFVKMDALINTHYVKLKLPNFLF